MWQCICWCTSARQQNGGGDNQRMAYASFPAFPPGLYPLENPEVSYVPKLIFISQNNVEDKSNPKVICTNKLHAS